MIGQREYRARSADHGAFHIYILLSVSRNTGHRIHCTGAHKEKIGNEVASLAAGCLSISGSACMVVLPSEDDQFNIFMLRPSPEQLPGYW